MKAIAFTILGAFAAAVVAVAVVGKSEFTPQRQDHGQAGSSPASAMDGVVSRSIDSLIEWNIAGPTRYEEFHKDVETGTYSDRYAIEAWLYPDGRHICSDLATYSSPAYCLTPDTLLRIENAFTGDNARSFYDLRGRCGCFLITTNAGALVVEDFVVGSCTTTEAEAAE